MEKGKTRRKRNLSLLPIGKSGWACSAVGLALLGAAALCLPMPAAAGTYKSSAHGSNTTGLYRNAGGVNWLNAPYSYSRGNCAHCHEEHASMGGAEGIPPAAATGSPSVYLGFSVEENLCFGCHNVAVPVGSATDKIKTDTDKAYGHGTGTTLNILGISARHRANETSVTGVSTSAHVECTDCHNPHVARTGNHTAAGVNGNAITGPSPLEGVSGVDFSPYPSTWANVTSWSAAGATAYATATKEYRICFKCHASSNSNTDDWDGNPAGANAAKEWTDVGLEFNPANASFHPIITGIANSTSAWKAGAIAAAKLVAPWNANGGLGTQTMYCSDCHKSDSAVAGPHGSATKWLLTGTNTAWPYTSAANNGTNAGTFFTPNNYTTGSGATGLFCLNCHTSLSNPPHLNTSQHKALACADCHIRVPHGGKVKRLIATTNIPARYKPNGDGTGTTSLTAVELGTGINTCQASCASEHSTVRTQKW